MKTVLIYFHLLSLASAIGSMLIAEHLIFFRRRELSRDSYDTVIFASRTVTVSLLLLWLTGTGLVIVGYLGDPQYIENQKIWAKVSIVLLMSINGIYIHRRLLPRFAELALGGVFIRTAAESARMRFAFAASLAGWLITAFYGAAKFLNHGYIYGELYGLYLMAVVLIFAFSYLVPDQWVNHIHDTNTVAGAR
jgi:uncharacterized membrane protein